MTRAIVNVATGHYVKGQKRLAAFPVTIGWTDELPRGCPAHTERPYAFKAYALKQTYEDYGHETLLWCDACMIPGARPLDELWEYIEEHGVWFAKNGYSNYEWTADSAYPDLFPGPLATVPTGMDERRKLNRTIPHVVATAFGISLKHDKGRAFLDEYFRLASETEAFCGPWINGPLSGDPSNHHRMAPCGPADVRGHRHDQTAASVIAWRLGVPLTECPEFFSYANRRADGSLHMEDQSPRTCLIADGAY
jgi:hypothetical protein